MSTTQAQAQAATAAVSVTPSPAEELAKQNRIEESRVEFGQQRENLKTYAEAGPLYASASPVANSVGAEVGFVTRDEKTGKVQRTGFGFYLRSDHISQVGYYGTVDI